MERVLTRNRWFWLSWLFIFAFLFFSCPTRVSAASQIAISGKAKAVNTGAYFDFTGYNSSVKVNSDTGAFSGYVFSEDLGWVDFGNTDNTRGPVAVNISTGRVTGKAYVLNTGSYIDFSANNSNVKLEGAAFTGYVFSDDIGWINFSDTGVQAAQAFLEKPTAAWSFDEGYGQTAGDSSGNNHNAILGASSSPGSDDPAWTEESRCYSGKCLGFAGGQYLGVATTVPDVKTVSLWVRPKTNGEAIIDLDGGSHKITASSGVITATGFNNIYVNGQPSVTLTADTWQQITVTASASFSASAITIGKVATSYLSGFVDEVRLYGTAKTPAQVKGIYIAKSAPKEVSAQFGPDNAWMTNGLVGYWKMDEATWSGTLNEVVDSSGNGNHGTASGSTNGMAYPTGGKFGNAGYFDGVDNCVSLGNPTSVLDNLTTYTYSGWFYHNNASTNYEIILWNGNTKQLRLDNSNRLEVFALSNGTGASSTLNSSFPSGSWQFVTVTYNDNTDRKFKIYINGSEATYLTQTAATGTLNSDANNNWYFGTDNGNGFYWDGKLDDIRVYNRALSPAEVSQLYHWAPGPVGYWKMDENTGTSAYDSSGNNSTGTFTGSPIWSPGKFGSALKFNGSTDYVDTNNQFNFNHSQSFTVNTWLKTSPLTGNQAYSIIDKGNGFINTYSLILGWCNGQSAHLATFLIYDSSTQISVNKCTGGTQINDNKWHYLTGVRDAANGKIYVYVDGNLEASASDTTTGDFNRASNVIIAARGVDYAQKFPGIVDDVKIYNYARTPSQIVQDMNGGHPAPGSPVGSAVGKWEFEEGYGDTTHNAGDAGSALDANLGGSQTCPGGAKCPNWNNDGRFGKALSFIKANETIATVPDKRYQLLLVVYHAQ